MKGPLHYSTTPGNCFVRETAPVSTKTPARPGLTQSTAAPEGPDWHGFGGCFNELGWQALQGLSVGDREAVMASLFGPDGLRLDIGRIPIGASDFALDWYSCDEVRDDFALQHFSIERDRQRLIPYIRAALEKQPNLEFFASPWSPPTWMKNPPVYNYGRFRMESPYLDAYARYFARFVQAYALEGIPIKHLHPQNEPCADQKFPSCQWEGADLARFIGDHLGPVLEAECPGTGLWLGTVNGSDYGRYFLPVLDYSPARDHLRGIGLQWAGKHIAGRLQSAVPELALWQTENECGDGTNSWKHAHHVFDLIVHYAEAGCSAYVYWNMVLRPGGESTWGWSQNALVTADPGSGTWQRNPEYHVLRHFSNFVRPGYRRLPLTGPWAPCSLAFQGPDGNTVLVTHNPTASPRRLDAVLGQNRPLSAELPPLSFHSFIWPG